MLTWALAMPTLTVALVMSILPVVLVMALFLCSTTEAKAPRGSGDMNAWHHTMRTTNTSQSALVQYRRLAAEASSCNASHRIYQRALA